MWETTSFVFALREESDILGVNLAVLDTFVPKRVLGMSREECHFDLKVEHIVLFAIGTTFSGDEVIRNS